MLCPKEKGQYQKVSEAEIPAAGLRTHLKAFDWVTLFRTETQGQKRHYVYYSYQKEQNPLQKVSLKAFEKAHDDIFSALWAFITLEEKVINKIIANWYQFREQIPTKLIKLNLM